MSDPGNGALPTTSMVGNVRLSCADTGAANAVKPTAATKAFTNSRTRHPTRPHTDTRQPPQHDGLHNFKFNNVRLGGKQEPRMRHIDAFHRCA